MPQYARQENWLLVLSILSLFLASSKVDSARVKGRAPYHQQDGNDPVYGTDSLKSLQARAWHTAGPQQHTQQAIKQIAVVGLKQRGDGLQTNTGENSGDNVHQSSFTVWRLPARILLQSRGSRGSGSASGGSSDGPTSKGSSRGDIGAVGRGAGISRGTDSPTRTRVTRRASADNGSSRTSGSSSQRSSSSSSRDSSNGGGSSFGSRRSSAGNRNSNRRSSLDRGSPVISTYQWIMDQMDDSP